MRNSKKYVRMLAFVLALVTLVGCNSKGKDAAVATNSNTSAETRIYESESGPMEIPYEPQRIVILDTSLSGHFIKLGASIAGIDSWTGTNPTFQDMLQDIPELSQDDVEQITALKPDLIVAPASNKNLALFGKLAPTITLTYGKQDYLERFVEVGKILNKEEEAKAWVEDFKARAAKLGEEVRSKHGDDLTVTVMESYDKQIYVYGDAFARGTEILYKEMKVKMPDTVKEAVSQAGMGMLSAEVIPNFVGDYLIICQSSASDHSFQQTETFKSIPAVQNQRYVEVPSSWFAFNDPITLDLQLTFIRDLFLGK